MITKNATSWTLLVHPSGNFDALKTQHYRRRLRPLIDEGYRFLLIDLEQVTHINSSAIGLFVELYNSVHRVKGTLRLMNCGPNIQKILQQTRLDTILMNEEAASANAESPVVYDNLHDYMSREILLQAKINAMISQILKSDRPEAIASAALIGILRALGAPKGALFLLNNDSATLELMAWRGNDKEIAPQLPAILVSENTLEHQILASDDLMSFDLSNPATAPHSIFNRLGFSSMLGAPILGDQRCYGLLALEAGPESEKIIEHSRPLVQSLIRICGLALEKAILVERFSAANEQARQATEQTRRYEQSLALAGRLSMMGVVLSSLTHLINNKLVPLMGYAQLLTHMDGLPEAARKRIQMIGDASNSLHEVIEKISMIHRQQGSSCEPLDLDATLAAALDLMQETLSSRSVAVTLHPVPPSLPIAGDGTQLIKAFVAILHSAAHAFTDDQLCRWIRISFEAGETAMKILFHDNGQDVRVINDDMQSQLDPFASNEDIRLGQIFNPHLPQHIIRRLGGKAMAEVSPVEGTIVTFELPYIENNNG